MSLPRHQIHLLLGEVKSIRKSLIRNDDIPAERNADALCGTTVY